MDGPAGRTARQNGNCRVRIDLDALKSLLLAMLGETEPVDLDLMAQLGEAEWSKIGVMSRQHRLGPMLDYRLKTRGKYWPVPDKICQAWQGSYRRAALRALASRRVLHNVAALLDAAAIPHAVLKGLWLAWHVYDHPALRPVRDIDIIVAKEHALAAYRILSRAGFSPRNPHGPAPDLALASGKHLPGLLSLDPKISIEIHHRLFTPSACRALPVLDTPGLMARRMWADGEGRRMACLSPTDALLHLIIHAAYEHCFCNGPLVLTDIAFLLRGAAIDWPLFWADAQAGGWTNGCCLVLALVEQYYATPTIPWPDGNAPPSASVMKLATLMMLQDDDQRGDVDLLSQFGVARSPWAKLGLAAKRAIPARHTLATFAARPPQSRWLWLAYPNWLVSRGKILAGNLATPGLREEVVRARDIKQWLRSSF
jgi:hypothetical protein